MKLHIFIFFLIGLLIGSSLSAQQSVLPSGKTIYIPKDLQGMDLQNPESKWSYRRMACTENFSHLLGKRLWERFVQPSTAGRT